MRGLSAKRKKVIKDMGFGDLIDFPISEIPQKLAFFVIDILDTHKSPMILKCPTGDILIDKKSVNQVLGMPMGRRKLEREGQRVFDDPFLQKWQDQFTNVNRITIKALSDLIIETNNADYLFRMNILTLISNCLGSCDNNATIQFTVLKNVFEGDDVNDIDWCGHILECTSLSKLAWDINKRNKTGKSNYEYYGPVTFLTLAYLHYTKFDEMDVRRQLPGLRSWNSKLINKREKHELKSKWMGNVDILPDVDEEEHKEKRKEIYEMIKEKIDSILIEKAELEEMITENLINCEDDQNMIYLKERFKEIFKEPHIPETSSSESDDESGNASEDQKEPDNNMQHEPEKQKNEEKNVSDIENEGSDREKDETNKTYFGQCGHVNSPTIQEANTDSENSPCYNNPEVMKEETEQEHDTHNEEIIDEINETHFEQCGDHENEDMKEATNQEQVHGTQNTNDSYALSDFYDEFSTCSQVASRKFQKKWDSMCENSIQECERRKKQEYERKERQAKEDFEAKAKQEYERKERQAKEDFEAKAKEEFERKQRQDKEDFEARAKKGFEREKIEGRDDLERKRNQELQKECSPITEEIYDEAMQKAKEDYEKKQIQNK